MRITYRSQGIKDYWSTRWEEIPVDGSMENTNVYPLKYSEMTVKRKDVRILEAGCGAGRLLRFYHQRNYDIVGVDFIEIAIEKLKMADPTLKVSVGDVIDLDFGSECFDYVLAFGLYHNLETGLEKAVQETYRVLKHGGAVCASFRADNFQTRLSDWLWRRGQQMDNRKQEFHKMNLTRKEFELLFMQAGFRIDFIEGVENMPILYKFKIFREKKHKIFDENMARADGYRLSLLGRIIQNLLMVILPHQFCNLYVLIAHKS